MFSSLLLLALTAQAPPRAPILVNPGPVAGPVDLKTEREIDLRKQVLKKQALARTKAMQRTAKTKREYEAYQAEAAYQAKMAPIWAEQQRKQTLMGLEVQKANALSSMANAAQREVNIESSRLKIQARQAGYPQFGLQQIVPSP